MNLFLQDWQKACKERNAMAHETSHALKIKELRFVRTEEKNVRSTFQILGKNY